MRTTLPDSLVSLAWLEETLRRWCLPIVLILSWLAFLLRISNLAVRSLIFEEGLALFESSQPFSAMIRILIQDDIHPPLYYIFLRLWLAVAGTGEFAVRFFSVLVGVLLVPIALAIVREIYPRRAAWATAGTVAVALIALSAYLGYYAQQARMYTLFATTSSLALLALLRATRTQAIRWWLAHALFLCAAAYTHYFTFLLGPPLALYAILNGRRSLLKWLGAAVLAALGYLPWIPGAYAQAMRFISAPDFFPGSIEILDTLEILAQTLLPTFPALVGLALLSATVGLGILAWALGRARDLSLLRRSSLVFLVAVLPILTLAAAMTRAPKLGVDYFMVSAVSLYLSLVIGLHALLWPRGWVGRIAFVVLTAAILLASSRQDVLDRLPGTSARREDLRGAAQYLAAHAQPDDAIILLLDTHRAFTYYYRGQAPWFGINPVNDVQYGINELNRVLAQHPRRVWLLVWHRDHSDPMDLVSTELHRVGVPVPVDATFVGYDLLAFDIVDPRPLEVFPPPQVPLAADFQGGLHLDGYDIISHNSHALYYVFYWRVDRRLPDDIRLSFTLRDGQNRVVSSRLQPLAGGPLSLFAWPLNTRIPGLVSPELPSDADLSHVRVQIAVYQISTDKNLVIERTNGTRRGDRLVLDDPRPVASYLSTHVAPSDSLLVVPDPYSAFGRFYNGPAPWRAVQVGRDFGAAAAALNAVLSSHPSRVWLVLWRPEGFDPTDMLTTELLYAGRPVELDQQFSGYTLRAFDIVRPDARAEITPAPQIPLQVRFGDGLLLNGADVLDWGDGIRHYVLYWRAQKRLERDYSATLRLLDNNGHEYLRLDRALSTPAFVPTTWPVDTTIRGRFDVELPADLPPLTYQVDLQVYDPVARATLSITDPKDTSQGPVVQLEQVSLTKNRLGRAMPLIPHRLDARLTDTLILLGYDRPFTPLRPGLSLPLALWWQLAQKNSGGQENNTFQIRLIDGGGQTVEIGEFPLMADYPASSWPPGEINRVLVDVALPGGLAAGNYTLQAGLRGTYQDLGTVQVEPLARLTELPQTAQPLDARFGHITLLGYETSPDRVQAGQSLAATLYWTTESRLANSFKVTVQLLDASGHLVAQEDSVPDHWTRPTTSWLPGEIIHDAHTLALPAILPAGPFTLIAALYDEGTGTRLPVVGGDGQENYARLTSLGIYPPAAVILWSERFARLPAFVDWVASHYLSAQSFGSGREVYLVPDRLPTSTRWEVDDPTP